MKKHSLGDYPSIKLLKYIAFIISIVVLVFCFIKTGYINRKTKIDSLKAQNNMLLTSSKALGKFSSNKNGSSKEQKATTKTKEEKQNTEPVVETKEEEVMPAIVYDGMTADQLAAKLDKSLSSTLSGTGYIFADYTAKTGMDPYLAVAIVLHETGCKWGCSDMVNTCYNVGGIKGSPGCYGGEYQAYSSLNDGIVSFLDKLYYSYYANGLTTPEAINPSYAESSTWASQVNSYIYEVRNA